jgi:hypothetical protein
MKQNGQVRPRQRSCTSRAAAKIGFKRASAGGKRLAVRPARTRRDGRSRFRTARRTKGGFRRLRELRRPSDRSDPGCAAEQGPAQSCSTAASISARARADSAYGNYRTPLSRPDPARASALRPGRPSASLGSPLRSRAAPLESELPPGSRAFAEIEIDEGLIGDSGLG